MKCVLLRFGLGSRRLRFAAVPVGLVLMLSATMLSATGCSEPASEPGLKALVGGRLEASLEAESIDFSVIVIADGKFRAAGPQATTPVPKGAETINAKGKLIRPMPYTAKVAEGEPANLMVFDAATGAPEGTMRNGEWE